MPIVTIPTESAVAIRRPEGSNVAIFNQSTVDVYFDQNPASLNAAVPGVAPALGCKLAANGGQYAWSSFPGVIWLRAATAYTNIVVEP